MGKKGPMAPDDHRWKNLKPFKKGDGRPRYPRKTRSVIAVELKERKKETTQLKRAVERLQKLVDKLTAQLKRFLITEKERKFQLQEYFDSLELPEEEYAEHTEELRISKCCATCKHFMPITAAKHYHRGFCTWGYKEEERSGIRLKYDTDAIRIGSLKNILPILRKTYPEVHEHFVCDQYVKVTKEQRLRQMVKQMKLFQNHIAFESDLEI